MGYKPIYDYTCDLVPLTSLDEVNKFLRSVFERKIVLLDYDTLMRNNSGDCTQIKIRGTKDQIVPWIREYYAAAEEDFEHLKDRDVMFWAEDKGVLVCIA